MVNDAWDNQRKGVRFASLLLVYFACIVAAHSTASAQSIFLEKNESARLSSHRLQGQVREAPLPQLFCALFTL